MKAIQAAMEVNGTADEKAKAAKDAVKVALAQSLGKTEVSNMEVNEFINEAFNYTGYKETFHVPRPSKWNCHFCPFKEDAKLCNVPGKNL